MGIRILLADDHTLLREGIKSLIASHQDISVIGEAPDGNVAVQLAVELSPDVVLMDISMPGLDGLEATRRILAGGMPTKVLALSMYLELKVVRGMLDAGASGYLLKENCFEELTHAIRVVSTSNGIYLSPPVADIFLKDYYKRVPADKMSPLSSLTPRERDVLQLLAQGKNTKEIASFFNFSVKNSELYRRRVMDKLAIRNIAELVTFAIKEGVTRISD